MSATYINPWHMKGRAEFGPEVYQTEARPAFYRGYVIYHRNASCFDVVQDGVCVTQRAGMAGAERAIDTLLHAASGAELGVRNCGTCAKTYTCADCDHESQQQLFDRGCPEHSMCEGAAQ